MRCVLGFTPQGRLLCEWERLEASHVRGSEMVVGWRGQCQLPAAGIYWCFAMKWGQTASHGSAAEVEGLFSVVWPL